MRDKIDSYDKWIMFLFALGFIFWCFCLSGCNAYKGIEKHEPKSTKDTVRLAKRSLATFPQKPGVYKEGKIITLPDSSEYWKGVAAIAGNKKAQVIKELEIQYKDTCQSVFDRYEQGYNDGIDVGYADGLSKCKKSTQKVDTVYQDSPQTEIQLFLMGQDLSDSSLVLRDNRNALNTLEAKTNSLKWTILHIFSFWQPWVLLLLIGLWKFKRPLLTFIKKF